MTKGHSATAPELNVGALTTAPAATFKAYYDLFVPYMTANDAYWTTIRDDDERSANETNLWVAGNSAAAKKAKKNLVWRNGAILLR